MIVSRALLEWPLVAAMTAAFGTSAFVIASAGDRAYDVSSAASFLMPLWRTAAIAALILSPLVAIDIVATMAGVPWREAMPFVRDVIMQTHAGRVWQVYFPALLILVLVAFVPMRSSRRTISIVAISALMLYLEAMLSHATDKGMLAISVYFVHELGAGLWFGALLAFWTISRRGNASSRAAPSAKRS